MNCMEGISHVYFFMLVAPPGFEDIVLDETREVVFNSCLADVVRVPRIQDVRFVAEELNHSSIAAYLGSGTLVIAVKYSSSFPASSLIDSFTRLHSAARVCAWLGAVNVSDEPGLIEKDASQVYDQVFLSHRLEPALELWRLSRSTNSSFNRDASPTFRATCIRHKWEFVHKHLRSVDLERWIGTVVYKEKRWKVDCTGFDLELYSELASNELIFGISLFERSLFGTSNPCQVPSMSPKEKSKRSGNVRNYFTGLKPEMAYCLLRKGMVKQPGHRPTGLVVLDPMCGTGTIPRMGCLAFPDNLFFGGDICDEAIEITTSTNMSRSFDVIKWDVRSCPLLRPRSIDVFCTDMPFGRRHNGGKKLMYYLLRTIRDTLVIGGRAVVMTMGVKKFHEALSMLPKSDVYLRADSYVDVSLGGLKAVVVELRVVGNMEG